MTCILPADTSCCPEWSDYPVELRASALVAASELLWRLTGRAFAMVPLSTAFTAEEMTELEAAGYTDGCSTILRPCRQHCQSACDLCGYGTDWADGPSFMPYLAAGQWYNLACCGDGCQCGNPLDEIELPGPVAQVNHVWVDGEEITDWALYNANILVRTNPDDGWPGCQRLDQDLTEVDTWAVDYTRGLPWPAGGRRVVGVLACEFARLCAGDKRCRIPANVTQVTRDGVSYNIDASAFIEQGLTGFAPEVDLFISSINPDRLRRPSGVYTPQTLRRDGYIRRQPPEVMPS